MEQHRVVVANGRKDWELPESAGGEVHTATTPWEEGSNLGLNYGMKRGQG